MLNNVIEGFGLKNNTLNIHIYPSLIIGALNVMLIVLVLC